MKSIRNKVIAFVLAVAALQILTEIVLWDSGLDNDQVHSIARGLLIFMFCILVFEVGRSLKNKMHRKRYIIYVAAFFLVTSMLVLLAHTVFNGNDWFNLAAPTIIFLMFLGVIFDISSVIKSQHQKMSSLLRLLFYWGIGLVVIFNILG